MFETTLGAALAALRKRAGLSMAEVIERLSMPRSTAYWHESASGRPSPEHLQALLDLYQATDDERLEAWRLRSLEEQALAYLTSVCRTLHDHRPELLQPMRGRWSGPDANQKAPSGLIYRRGAVLAIVSPWDVPVVTPSGHVGLVSTPSGPVGFMPPADSELWLHVSVSRPDRPPTYDELTDARNQLFRPTDTVLHVWPPRDEHFNLHPHCLHLWTPMNGRRPIPDLRGRGGGV